MKWPAHLAWKSLGVATHYPVHDFMIQNGRFFHVLCFSPARQLGQQVWMPDFKPGAVSSQEPANALCAESCSSALHGYNSSEIYPPKTASATGIRISFAMLALPYLSSQKSPPCAKSFNFAMYDPVTWCIPVLRVLCPEVTWCLLWQGTFIVQADILFKGGLKTAQFFALCFPKPVRPRPSSR